MKQKADIGLIGLAVMGENLVLNMESKGYTVAVYNRTVSKVHDFVEGRGKGKNFIGADSLEEFVNAIERPRKVMMLVKAGKPVDDFIELLIPLLEPGDIIIDGGNSHFPRYYPPDSLRGEQRAALRGYRCFRWGRGSPLGAVHDAGRVAGSMAARERDISSSCREGG